MPSAASRLGGAGFDGEVMMRLRDYVAGGLGRSVHRRGQWVDGEQRCGREEEDGAGAVRDRRR